MTIVQHLDELRTRLLRSIGALLLTVTVAMIFYRDLIDVAPCRIPGDVPAGEDGRFSLSVTDGSVRIMKLPPLSDSSSFALHRAERGLVAASLYRERNTCGPCAGVVSTLPAGLRVRLLHPDVFALSRWSRCVRQSPPIIDIGPTWPGFSR
jgi:hypothetical protein